MDQGKTMDRTLDYWVNDTSIGGLMGFCGDRQAIKDILYNRYGSHIGYCLLDEIDILTGGRDAAEIKAACMPYYTPCPVDSRWTDEYAAIVQQQIAKQEYIGTCKVPVDIATGLIYKACDQRAIKYARQEIEDAKRILGAIEQAKASGTLYRTSADARQAAIDYNNAVNEGGYGYVPGYYCEDDAAHYSRKLRDMETVVAQINNTEVNKGWGR